METLIFIAVGYAVLFYLLKRTGIVDAPGEVISGLVELVPLLVLGVEFVNWLFGTDFSQDTWAYVWFTFVGIWTLVAIWALVDEPRIRRERAERLRRILNGDAY